MIQTDSEFTAESSEVKQGHPATGLTNPTPHTSPGPEVAPNVQAGASRLPSAHPSPHPLASISYAYQDRATLPCLPPAAVSCRSLHSGLPVAEPWLPWLQRLWYTALEMPIAMGNCNAPATCGEALSHPIPLHHYLHLHTTIYATRLITHTKLVYQAARHLLLPSPLQYH
jgi:hypothetical protein